MTDLSFTLKIADLFIKVIPVSERLRPLVSRYVAERADHIDFTVELSPKDVETENEWLALQRKITERIIDFNVVLIHASALSIDGSGYMYLGKSGTGKSTHARLVREVYGSRVKMVNDDKPFVRVTENGAFVCGSPWCGKHNLETPECVPLRGLCFLHQAPENSITELVGFDAFKALFPQVYRQPRKEAEERTLELLEKLLGTVKCYSMNCNMEPEAAITSIRTMHKVTFEQLLKKDGEITYRTRGTSMQPMLTENRDVVIIKSVTGDEVKKYDVVLYRRPGDAGRYVLHRVMKVKENTFDIIGDNQYRMERNVPKEWIIGRLTSFIRDGKEIATDDPEYLDYVKKTTRSYPKRALKGFFGAAVGKIRRIFKNRTQKETERA